MSLGSPPNDPAAANEVAKMIASAHETFAPLDEAALGHRTHLITAGWSASAAEQMAAHFYSFQVALLMHDVHSADGVELPVRRSAADRVISALSGLALIAAVAFVAVLVIQSIAHAVGGR